jgi:hypothetical protein
MAARDQVQAELNRQVRSGAIKKGDKKTYYKKQRELAEKFGDQDMTDRIYSKRIASRFPGDDLASRTQRATAFYDETPVVKSNPSRSIAQGLSKGANAAGRVVDFFGDGPPGAAEENALAAGAGALGGVLLRRMGAGKLISAAGKQVSKAASRTLAGAAVRGAGKTVRAGVNTAARKTGRYMAEAEDAARPGARKARQLQQNEQDWQAEVDRAAKKPRVTNALKKQTDRKLTGKLSQVQHERPQMQRKPKPVANSRRTAREQHEEEMRNYKPSSNQQMFEESLRKAKEKDARKAKRRAKG